VLGRVLLGALLDELQDANPMPARFQSIHSPGRVGSAWSFRSNALPSPANENSAGSDGDRIVDAALRHFSIHGLSAIDAAGAEAEAAWRSGDRLAAVNWLAICRVFDRRRAELLETRLSEHASAIA
jgi:hypothetical protein